MMDYFFHFYLSLFNVGTERKNMLKKKNEYIAYTGIYDIF